jgi:predicted HTH domain antitoxin
VLSDLVGEESPERRKVLIRIPPELDTLLRYEARLQNLSKNAFMTRLLLEGVKGERPVATTKVTKKKVTKKKVTKASRKPTVHDLEIESRGCRLGLEVAITLLQEKASTLFMQKQDRLAAFARDVAEELIAHRDFSPEDLGADDEGDFSPEGDGGDGWD